MGQWPGGLPPVVFQPHASAQRIIDLPSTFPDEAARRSTALEQRRFEESFNRLTESIVEFAEQYNHHRTIDVKKVRAMKKAWHELEKSEPWFKGK
jgi:hypothetical protein